jgi:hypothetical protein
MEYDICHSKYQKLLARLNVQTCIHIYLTSGHMTKSQAMIKPRLDFPNLDVSKLLNIIESSEKSPCN